MTKPHTALSLNLSPSQFLSVRYATRICDDLETQLQGREVSGSHRAADEDSCFEMTPCRLVHGYQSARRHVSRNTGICNQGTLKAVVRINRERLGAGWFIGF
jgi:hypothetical protein